MSTYDIVKDGKFSLVKLQSEINSSVLILPSCISITSNDQTLTFDFGNGTLTEAETMELNDIVLAHTMDVVTIEASVLPISSVDGYKLAVHSSSKPETDEQTYAVWTGCGDEMDTTLNPNGDILTGEMLEFDMTTGTPDVIKDVKFDPNNGKVWVHEAYLRFENGGRGDSIEAFVVSEPTPLQQVANLDLVVDGDGFIKYSSAGPGTGTHGFADASKVQLLPRSYSMDGDWDYNEATGLTPNFSSSGGYKISTTEQIVHRYYSKVPCRGTCPTFFSMTSDDTAWLAPNFFIRICANNTSNTNWFASVIMEIYRERTYVP